jgi:hypothetical protein
VIDSSSVRTWQDSWSKILLQRHAQIIKRQDCCDCKVVDVETSVVKMAYATLANKAAADEVAKTLAANV